MWIYYTGCIINAGRHFRSVFYSSKWVYQFSIEGVSQFMIHPVYRLFTRAIFAIFVTETSRSPEMPADPAGVATWFILARGMQILHKLYTSDVGCRTCMRFKSDETSAGTPGTTATGCHPPPFCPFAIVLSLSFSDSSILFAGWQR